MRNKHLDMLAFLAGNNRDRVAFNFHAVRARCFEIIDLSAVDSPTDL
jgi:hypothetical protein